MVLYESAMLIKDRIHVHLLVHSGLVYSINDSIQKEVLAYPNVFNKIKGQSSGCDLFIVLTSLLC